MRSYCVALGTRSSHLWWSMMKWEKRTYTCMCNWVTLLYSRKLTEHCKPAITEKIKIIINEKKKVHCREMFKFNEVLNLPPRLVLLFTLIWMKKISRAYQNARCPGLIYHLRSTAKEQARMPDFLPNLQRPSFTFHSFTKLR